MFISRYCAACLFNWHYLCFVFSLFWSVWWPVEFVLMIHTMSINIHFYCAALPLGPDARDSFSVIKAR